MYQAQNTRYQTMRYSRCGNSGLKLPAVSLGFWHNFGDTSPFKTMKQLCFTAFDHGITHFDLANNYGPDPGSAERNLGRILREELGSYRDELIINQNRYSIFDRTIEQNGLKETAAKLQKGIIAFSPLAQGLLTDRYLYGIPADSRIKTDGRFLHASDLTEKRLRQIKALHEIAISRGQTLAEMALSWILRDGIVTSVLVGASKPSQILDNIKALENTAFSEEEQTAIDQITAL